IIVPSPVDVTLYDLTSVSDTLTIINDTFDPVSSVNPLSTYTTANPATIAFTASDVGGGVRSVELWYNKDAAGWQLYGTDTSGPPWSIDFNSSTTGGDGLYEFYSRAYDNRLPVGNYEGAPLSNDTWTIIDTQKPSSSADALPIYTATSSFAVNLTVLPDTNGLQKVELWYDKDSGGDTLYSANFIPPWTFNFDTTITGGDGRYEFHSRAYDVPGNIEDVPPIYDTMTMVDMQDPVSSVNAQPAYQTASAFSLDVTATDPASGVDKVELWYNKDSVGWMYYGDDTSSPWSFNFNSLTTGGNGFYEFYSIAHDNIGRVESAPVGSDASTIVDTVTPSSAVNALTAYTTASTFFPSVTALPDMN
ncbi:MAG: hypothetical protein KAI64_03245, partial [Thermoplasmata archaeon]|nr:hypothetical protein [Thermoplasmata archaeon]